MTTPLPDIDLAEALRYGLKLLGVSCLFGMYTLRA